MWIAAIKAEFYEPLLFHQWASHVNLRVQQQGKTLAVYMYSCLQQIKQGRYPLMDADVVDPLIKGIQTNTHKPMLSAFYDLHPGSISDFLIHVSRLDRQTDHKYESEIMPSPSTGTKARLLPTSNAATVPHASSPKVCITMPAILKLDICSRC